MSKATLLTDLVIDHLVHRRAFLMMIAGEVVAGGRFDPDALDDDTLFDETMRFLYASETFHELRVREELSKVIAKIGMLDMRIAFLKKVYPAA